MWCLQFCPCWKGSSPLPETENSGLLISSQKQSKEANATKTQYYTVRRISSFGRAGSGDDVSDSGREQDAIQSPAEFWTPKIHKVQPDILDGDCMGDAASPSKPPRGRWKRAFHPLRPVKEGNRFQPPPITVSSPDLQRDEEEEEQQQQKKSPYTSHVKTVTNMSSISVIQPQTKWLKSQSMQNINTAIKPSQKTQEDAAQIARSYGLDTSLYAPSHIEECGPMSKSTEALNAWRSPVNSDNFSLYEESASGVIHFSASYYQKSKRLFIHVNRIEGLPPKGEHYTYSIIVKLVVLPAEKPVRISKKAKDDLNPVIEEDFEFHVKDPLGKVLRLSVYDAEHQGKYDAVGHALFYLEDVIAGRPRRYTMKLYKQSQPDVSPGIIHLTLSYKKETMVTTVLVKEARNLLLSTGITKNNRLIDKYNTYVKVVYYFAGQKSKSKKTSVVANSRNPTYNQTFSFKLSANFLHDTVIVVSVMMKGVLKKDVTIGRLILGPFHYGEGRVRTPWGRALVDLEEVNQWFRMYL